MIKELINKFIYRIVQNKSVYRILKRSVIRLADVIRDNKHTFENNLILETNPKILDIFKDLTVLHGPFKGLRYPDLKAYGSPIFPKLIGSYEIELESVIEGIIREKYKKIIDVGCAEGFYAVGLARAIPETTVYAFDISEKALSLCRKMAEINNVEDRLVLGSFFSEESLLNFDMAERTLLISDCEGYEKRLFTSRSVEKLKNCDVLIETHDLYDYSISYIMKDLFKDTHDLTVILSTEDLQKMKTYKYSELESLTISEKKVVLEEMRARIQEWHFYKAKRSTEEAINSEK